MTCSSPECKIISPNPPHFLYFADLGCVYVQNSGQNSLLFISVIYERDYIKCFRSALVSQMGCFSIASIFFAASTCSSTEYTVVHAAS